jgi:hypothetical protein
MVVVLVVPEQEKKEANSAKRLKVQRNVTA